MKTEFRFNGRCEIRFYPENEEEMIHLRMITKRAKNNMTVKLEEGELPGEYGPGAVISVER